MTEHQSFLVLLSFFLVLLTGHSWRCDYYLKYNEDLGLSVFSGHIFEPFEVFDVGVGVPVPLTLVYTGDQLVNYVEAYNSTHALLTLGLGMLLNHNENPNKINIRKYLSEAPPLMVFPSNGEPSIDILFEYSASISRGDQLFVHYGEEWFEERNMKIADTSKHLQDTDESTETKIPGCVREYVTLFDGRLLAKRDISEGITIETSRAIFLPPSPSLLQYRGPFADILWWLRNFQSSSSSSEEVAVSSGGSSAISSSDFSHALLLSGYGSFYGTSHPSSSSSSSSSSSDKDKVSEGNVEAIWDNESSASKESLPLLLKFVSRRAIKQGEELILSNLQLQPATTPPVNTLPTLASTTRSSHINHDILDNHSQSFRRVMVK